MRTATRGTGRTTLTPVHLPPKKAHPVQNSTPARASTPIFHFEIRRSAASGPSLAPFSIFTFLFSVFSNRHSPELETISNPYKTKAGDDF